MQSHWHAPTSAYNICKERIEAVEQALNETLNGSATSDNPDAYESTDI